MQAYTMCLLIVNRLYISLNQAVVISSFWEHTAGNRQTLHEHMVVMGDQMVNFELSAGATNYKPDAYAFMPV